MMIAITYMRLECPFGQYQVPFAVFQSSLTITSSEPSSCFFFAPHIRQVRLIKSGGGVKITIWNYQCKNWLFEDVSMSILAYPVSLPITCQGNFKLVILYCYTAAGNTWRNPTQVVHKARQVKNKGLNRVF
jgi:hypothetical protein